MKILAKLNQTLGLSYNAEDKDRIWLASQVTLRRLVGILGILLPILLWLGLYIDTRHSIPIESISHYYYTRMAGVLILIVGLLAFFLIIYKGDAPLDFYLSLAAGFFALMLLLFPASELVVNCTAGHKVVVTTLKNSAFRSGFHLASAGIFLGCLAFMSIWVFTKPEKWKDQRYEILKSRKYIRNRWYIGCGVAMLLFITAIFIAFLTDYDEKPFYKNNQLTFWFESLAVWSFGISWTIKGHTIPMLNDKRERV